MIQPEKFKDYVDQVANNIRSTKQKHRYYNKVPLYIRYHNIIGNAHPKLVKKATNRHWNGWFLYYKGNRICKKKKNVSKCIGMKHKYVDYWKHQTNSWHCLTHLHIIYSLRLFLVAIFHLWVPFTWQLWLPIILYTKGKT